MAGGFSLGFFWVSSPFTLLSRLIGRHGTHAWVMDFTTGFTAWLVWLDRRRGFSARRDDEWVGMDGWCIARADGLFRFLCDDIWPVFGTWQRSFSLFLLSTSVVLLEPWTGWVGRLRRTTGADCDGMPWVVCVEGRTSFLGVSIFYLLCFWCAFAFSFSAGVVGLGPRPSR